MQDGVCSTWVTTDEHAAALYGGWAEGAVTNADLSFTTRARADGPRVLADIPRGNMAVGIPMAAPT